MLRVESRTPAQTEALGGVLAGMLADGATVALRGGLATGKTCLVRGMVAVCAQGAAVHSPTFTLVNEYPGSPTLHHLDLYRLAGPEEVAELGCEELFDGPSICVIEWAERADGMLPERRLDVWLEHGGGDLRIFHFDDHGLLPKGWETRIRDAGEA